MTVPNISDSPERYVLTLLDLAAELAATVRDYGPDDTAQVLARVPAGRHADLCVVLAAMVDPDRSPADLVAWVLEPPPTREEFTPRHLSVREAPSESLTKRQQRDVDTARLTAAGWPARAIAEELGITPRSVHRIRTRIRPEQDEAAA